MPEIAREIHLRHPTFAHEAFDGIPSREYGREGVGCEHEPSARVG
jgi:hypothetical protein